MDAKPPPRQPSPARTNHGQTALLDPVFRLSLCQRLGYPARGAEQRFGGTPLGGASRAHGYWTNMADTPLAAPRASTQDDQTASETFLRSLPGKLVSPPPSNRPCSSYDQIMPDGQLAPGSVRPIHRADVHIIEPADSVLREEQTSAVPMVSEWCTTYRPWREE